MYRRALPHWRIEGAIYFVTWRLAVDQPVLSAKERTIVRDALVFADGKSFILFAYVVMDHHVHLLVQPRIPLEKVIHSWKSYTTRVLQQQRDRALGGRIWQTEYYARIVRSAADLVVKTRYILENPLRRWPNAGRYEWVWALGYTESEASAWFCPDGPLHE
ncbi:MAG: transposase [Myxococcales bacterium]